MYTFIKQITNGKFSFSSRDDIVCLAQNPNQSDEDRDRSGDSKDTGRGEGKPESDGENESDKKGAGFPPGKSPRSPTHTLIIWLVILFAVPVAIYFIGSQQEEKPQELLQSEFEKNLEDGNIENIKIEKDPGNGKTVLRGKFQTDAGGIKRYKSEVMYTNRLDEKIYAKADEEGLEVKSETQSKLWTNLLVSVLPILLLVILLYFLFARQLKAAGKGALHFGKSKAQLANPTQESVTFDDVAGIREAKEEVEEIVEFLSEPDKFRNIGGKIPKGALMVGPPGTGKTLLAKAIAGEAQVPFYSISGSDFVEMFVGVGASRVRDMFDEAERNSPCLIFIDEIDAVGRSRFSGIGGGHDEREQTLNALLAEMDGFDPSTNIIVIAATNRPDVLDPALMRPGRFDRRIAIDMPDIEGRLEILNIHTTEVELSENADLRVIAKGTPGFSGADLANLVNEGALGAARLDKTEIELEDLEEARDKVRFGKERQSRKIDEGDRKITAYHEAGHTMVSLYCENATPLHKITIIPRGTSFLGATMNLPDRDRYTQSRHELLDELAVLMGGRIAEEKIFNDVTSGAAMDLRQATEIAQKMVCEFGMSESLGLVAYGQREEHIYLGRDITRTKDYSEATAREIDEEVRGILQSARERATQILSENSDKLQLLGETVLEKETLTADETKALLGLEEQEESEMEGETETAAENTEVLSEHGADSGNCPDDGKDDHSAEADQDDEASSPAATGDAESEAEKQDGSTDEKKE